VAEGEHAGPDTAPEAHTDSDDNNHTADTHSADGGGTADGDDDKVGFRTHGKSKDHRGDLPQVVVGMAVTRTGIPIRSWCWPGNTGDSALIRQVRDDLRDWKLSRVMWVADRGFTSAENRRYLQRGGGHPRREAALRISGGHRRARPPGPLPAGRREPASQAGPPRTG
jgi:hypothetical protein